MSWRMSNRQFSLVLVITTLATRLPFQSTYLYHWDSVNFAMALSKFDILQHQPHPPGYVLYVLSGRLLNIFLNDPNQSLVLLSLIFSPLMILAVFWLGNTLFGQRVGVISALLALTSPIIWFHGEVALSYITEGFFVAIIGLLSYKVLCGETKYVLPLAIIFGLSGGFRQNTIVFLFPLWLFSLHVLSWRLRAVATLALIITVLLWVGLLIYLSGGLDNYINAITAQTTDNLAISGATGLTTVLTNGFRLALYMIYSLPLGLLVLLVGLVWMARRWRILIRDIRFQVFGIWILPAFIFYVFFVQQAGYVFTILPAIVVLIAFVLTEIISPGLARRDNGVQVSLSILVGVLVITNVLFFFAAPPFLFNEKKQVFNTSSWPAIQSRNMILNEKIHYIRNHFSSDETLIVTDSFDFHIPDFYLPDYPATTSSESAFDPSDQPEGVRYIVLFDDETETDDNLLWNSEQMPFAEHLRWIDLSLDRESLTLNDRSNSNPSALMSMRINLTS